MATRTIEDIHVVLPVAEGGYYRFGGLPGLIADALYPECPDADEEAQELQWMRHAIYGVEKFKKDLMRAAHVAAGEPGYLHVAENSASKRPLEWRMGAVLESGLVHLDWLNEWGESRRPCLVFSTAAPAQSHATPAPVADSASTDTKPDPERRLARLRALGGCARYKRNEWKFTGMAVLVASEKSEGRARCDEKTIRADLKEAAQNELEAKRAGFGSGLGQR